MLPVTVPSALLLLKSIGGRKGELGAEAPLMSLKGSKPLLRNRN